MHAADLEIFLSQSQDPKLNDYGGAISLRCKIQNHEIYETYENWIIYDPDLIQGDLPRDFVLAHEIAHHMNGDTYSGRPPSRELELRADYNGSKYLLSMGWSKERLLHALDLLNLPQGSQPGYPTREERKAMVIAAAQPPGPPPPTDLQAYVEDGRPPSREVFMDRLLNGYFTGPVRFQSVRTGKNVSAKGTPDPKIPTTRHFFFSDNQEPESGGGFDLEPSPDGKSGYWLLQVEFPCPGYAANCHYALQSVGHNLQFWNQDLAADATDWRRELGEQELFTFEASDVSEAIVRIKSHKDGFLVVDPTTGHLQTGGRREEAAEFRVLFDIH